MLDRIPILILRHRMIFVFALLAMTVFFAVQIRHCRMASYADDLLPGKHPYVQVNKEFREIFGGANIVLVAVTVKEGDIFNPQTLQKIQNITRAFQHVPAVNNNSITSIAVRKVKNIRSTAWGMKIQPVMYPAVPQTQEEIERLKRLVYTDDMILGKLVSKDGKSALIMADFFEDKMDPRVVFEKVMEMKENEEDANTSVHPVGEPILIGWAYKYAPQMLWIFGVTVLVLILLLYGYFRSVRGTAIPLLSAGVSAIWGLGFTGLLHYNFDPLILVVPFLISARACSHSVQMVERYFEEYLRNEDPVVACQAACRGLLAPGLLGIVTDAAGILIIVVAPIPLLTKLALIGAFWVLSIIFSVLILNPLLLSFLPPPSKALTKFLFVEDSLLNRFLARVAVATFSRARCVTLAVTAVVLVWAFSSARNLTIGDAHEGTSLLWPDSQFNRDIRHINKHFPGVNPLYVIVEGTQENDFKRPEVLRAIEAYQRVMELDPRVGGTQSITDVLKQLNRKFHEDDPRWGVIPNEWNEVGQLMYLFLNGADPGDLDRWMNWNFSQGNIVVFFKDHKGETIRNAIHRSKEFIEDHPLDGVQFKLCGGVIGVMAAINEEISQSQTLTLALAFLVIFVTCSITYRSPVAGILFIMPLAVANVLTFAFMASLKIGLNINTLPISSLGIGLGVDYGIYIVSRIKEEYTSSGDLRKATRIAMTTAGRAVLFTATTLTAGVIFWYFLSDMRFQAEMGLLLGLWMITSMIGGMLLLTTVIHFIKPGFITRAAALPAPGKAPTTH
jgi:predicted RND superfamily exporter protein